jgi:hypothetical protein
MSRRRGLSATVPKINSRLRRKLQRNRNSRFIVLNTGEIFLTKSNRKQEFKAENQLSNPHFQGSFFFPEEIPVLNCNKHQQVEKNSPMVPEKTSLTLKIDTVKQTQRRRFWRCSGRRLRGFFFNNSRAFCLPWN